MKETLFGFHSTLTQLKNVLQSTVTFLFLQVFFSNKLLYRGVVEACMQCSIWLAALNTAIHATAEVYVVMRFLTHCLWLLLIRSQDLLR